jgi:hypothetical protein
MKNAIHWDVELCRYPLPRFSFSALHSVARSVTNSLTLSRSRYSFYGDDGGDTFLRNVGL